MISAQKTDVTIPIARVIPKPLTGPVPSQINILAVIKVVKFASIIVEKAFHSLQEGHSRNFFRL